MYDRLIVNLLQYFAVKKMLKIQCRSILVTITTNNLGFIFYRATLYAADYDISVSDVRPKKFVVSGNLTDPSFYP